MEKRLERLRQCLRTNSEASRSATSEPKLHSRILERLDKLEVTLQRFRSEVDMKMTIIYEILSMNCERMNNTKKSELQKQHDCETLLESWKNIEDLAANKLSLRILYDINNDMELLEVPDNYRVETTKNRRNISVVDNKRNSKRPRKMYKLHADTKGTEKVNSDLSSDDLVSESNFNTEAGGMAERRHRNKKKSRTLKVARRSQAFLVKTKNKIRPRTAVWENFEITIKEDWPRPRAVCKHCKKAVSGEAHRLRKHIRKCPQKHQLGFTSTQSNVVSDSPYTSFKSSPPEHRNND